MEHIRAMTSKYITYMHGLGGTGTTMTTKKINMQVKTL